MRDEARKREAAEKEGKDLAGQRHVELKSSIDVPCQGKEAAERRRQEDSSRLYGEIKELGKKVDGVGERLTRPEGRFDESGRGTPPAVAPPA